MLSRLLIAALWSPAGKGLTSLLLLVMFIFFLLPMWYSGSGVILDCIDSLSLPPFLLCAPQVINRCNHVQNLLQALLYVNVMAYFYRIQKLLVDFK